MSGLRPKALSVLRSGRLTVLRAVCTSDHTVTDVTAAVRSSREGGPTYAVDCDAGQWTCTCRLTTGCAHIAAVQLVTGHPSEAAA